MGPIQSLGGDRCSLLWLLTYGAIVRRGTGTVPTNDGGASAVGALMGKYAVSS